jgi:hypothetical protein
MDISVQHLPALGSLMHWVDRAEGIRWYVIYDFLC